jgi:uncharacterized RDD family membrane protein YckC
MSEPVSDTCSVSPVYAAPWKRLAAFLIDLPALFALTTAARALFGPHEGLECVLTCWLYYAGLESYGWQATLGKKALGLKVTGVSCGCMGLLRASARYWAKLISLVSLGAGFAMMFFTEKRQAFHDYIAGCVIVDERATVRAEPPGPPE